MGQKKVKKVKKIYERRFVITDTCRWCEGTGRTMGLWHSESCLSCDGVGGRGKWQNVLVGEEITYE